MKLIREHIVYEKFTPDSDPIDDLKIGMMHQIKKYVESKGGDFDEADYLWICACDGKLDYVKCLLNKGADVHKSDDRALRFASYNGHIDVVKVLLDHGANVHADDDYAMKYAKDNGHTKVVKLLKDHIAKLKK